jgi:hypothetical protein
MLGLGQNYSENNFLSFFISLYFSSEIIVSSQVATNVEKISMSKKLWKMKEMYLSRNNLIIQKAEVWND